jgi:preprotein translocase subunit SecF
MKISTAGIVAFLMLIGYSVDTDILLTTRMLKLNKSTNSSLFSAFKTGTTMTLTSIIAVSAALIVISPFSTVLNQIFIILLIGLAFDLLNTWITNASIIKWYVSHNHED